MSRRGTEDKSTSKQVEFLTTHFRVATISIDRPELERLIQDHLRAEYGLGMFDNRRTFDFAFDIYEPEGCPQNLLALRVIITDDMTKSIGQEK